MWLPDKCEPVKALNRRRPKAKAPDMFPLLFACTDGRGVPNCSCGKPETGHQRAT